MNAGWRMVLLTLLTVGLLVCALGASALAQNQPELDIRAADQAKDRGDYTSAMQLYNRALRSGQLPPPKQAGVHFKRGAVFGIIGDRPAMLDEYAKAVKLVPGSAYFRLIYGGALMQQGDYDQAAEQFKAAARLEPESVFPVSALGVLYWEQGKDKTAEKYLSQATDMKPDSGWELEKLATFHLSLGQYDKALKTFQRAAKLEPDSAELPLLQYVCAKLANHAPPTSYESAAAKADLDAWPGPVYLLYSGRLSSRNFLTSVDKHAPEERARLEVAARYYLAYWRMMRGETGLAKKSFAWLWENAPYTSLSRTAARAELMRRER